MTKEDQSRIIIISGPSGTGKSTIIKQLMERNQSILEFSVSTTTRSKRPNEQEGVDYFFVDRTEFQEKFNRGEFLEIAEVHGNHYGTAKQTIQNILSKNSETRCLLDIDVQGALSVTKIYPHTKRIFILPPSLEELKRRLNHRGDTSAKEVELRLQNAIQELAFIPYYNYFVVNTTTESAVKEIEKDIYGSFK